MIYKEELENLDIWNAMEEFGINWNCKLNAFIFFLQ